jgi:hypothetical protein
VYLCGWNIAHFNIIHSFRFNLFMQLKYCSPNTLITYLVLICLHDWNIAHLNFIHSIWLNLCICVIEILLTWTLFIHLGLTSVCVAEMLFTHLGLTCVCMAEILLTWTSFTPFSLTCMFVCLKYCWLEQYSLNSV